MTKKQPLVSILLSIYKVEEYLEECLDSILKQSYKNLEIVCVDNGSPDKCGEILKKYAKKDERIKIVTLKENRMLCGGRNAGLDNAHGEFICFVDPDDWIEKNYIKAMVDAIMTKKDSAGKPYNLIVNTAAVNYINKTNKIVTVYDREVGNYSISDYNTDVNVDIAIPMWGRLYRKSFLVKNKLRFLDYTMMDNLPFTLKALSLMQNFYCISSKIAKNAKYWRRLLTPDGAITSVVLWKNFEIPACLEDLYDYLCNNGFEKKLRVPFHLFFTLCFPRHIDMPGYYARFKALMQKMENDIKTSGVYTQEDINLCNLLIYTGNFFQFADLYFRPVSMPQPQMIVHTFKLFHILPVFSSKYKGNVTKYRIFGVLVWKTKKKYNNTRSYLFGFIPLIKHSWQ